MNFHLRDIKVSGKLAMTRKKIKFQTLDIHQTSSARLAASHELIIRGVLSILGGLSTWVSRCLATNVGLLLHEQSYR